MLLFWLALAGALGALARFGVAHTAQAWFPGTTPLGAFLANVLGCAIFGVILQLEATAAITARQKLVLAVGFLGSFTTFSTYVVDVVALAEAGRVAAASAWVVAHNAVGVAAFVAGSWLGRALC